MAKLGKVSSADPAVETQSESRRRKRLRLLKLELEKTRREARAERLDARAAELEMKIRQLTAELSSNGVIPAPVPRPAKHGILAPEAEEKSKLSAGTQSVCTEIRQTDPSSEKSSVRIDPSRDKSGNQIKKHRRDHSPNPKQDGDSAARVDKSHSKESPVRLPPESTPPESTPPRRSVQTENRQSIRKQSRRRGAFVYSVLSHIAIVFVLGLVTFSNESPRDQIALAGSISDGDESMIESIPIETVADPLADFEPSERELESESPMEISEIGRVPVPTQITSPPAAPTVPLSTELDTRLVDLSAMSLHADNASTMQFCGVEGGGKHFVYLVDSSGSMGDAFVSARAELLRSIDVLSAEQRFYVVFFDEQPDYMRIRSPDTDEPRSVFATMENKAALKRWAMGVEMDRGRAPYEALSFAIELRPDVIFLLSDGEFPERIEKLLLELNRADDLFGDASPISIVHTIGYHSREGEERMKRIAAQNGGAYRHVPKP